jgi:peptidoglycan/LPS O-acetylase OafA/YrhL
MNADAVLQRLARRTSTGRYIPEIDGMRFVSIMLVLLFHVGIIVGISRGTEVLISKPFGGTVTPASGRGLFMDLLDHGSFGVELFFLVSGFVLALPFIAAQMRIGPPIRLRRYFLRRVTRIEPPYVVALTICAVAATVADGGVGLGHYLTGLLYLHGLTYSVANPLNGVTWSLEVEIQFYLLVPLLAVLFSSRDVARRRMLMFLLGLLATAYQLNLYTPRAWTFVGTWLQFFLAGWLLADIYVTEWRGTPLQDRRWDLVSLIGWPVLFWGLVSWPMFERVLAPWVAMALFAAAFRGPLTRRVLTNRWLATIGGMCYSIYLVHFVLLVSLRPAIAGIQGVAPWMDVLIYVIVLLPIVVAVSAVFFVLVERPCMDPAWASRVARWARTPGSRERRTEAQRQESTLVGASGNHESTVSPRR